MKILLALPLLVAWADAGKVFINRRDANQHLTRQRRDNNGIFEEVMAGDLQRECVDEICSYDELLEAFDKDTDKADEWWNAATKMCNQKDSCDSAGTQTCVNKWRGRVCKCRVGYHNVDMDNCSEDVNECLEENFCKNNGECENLHGSFKCTCPLGWEGDQCQNDVNECEAASNPCQNGGTCTNTEGSFECTCTAEWEGERCEIDINECDVSDPCMNDSGCINRLGGYQCLCNKGWGGQNCDEDYDECGNGLCPAGTVCSVIEMNQFVCTCPERGCNNLDEEEYSNLQAEAAAEASVDEPIVDYGTDENSDDSGTDYNGYDSYGSEYVDDSDVDIEADEDVESDVTEEYGDDTSADDDTSSYEYEESADETNEEVADEVATEEYTESSDDYSEAADPSYVPEEKEPVAEDTVYESGNNDATYTYDDNTAEDWSSDEYYNDGSK